MNDQETRDTEVLDAPKETDPNWQKKIELAVRAREQAAEIRKGKPASFRAAGQRRISKG